MNSERSGNVLYLGPNILIRPFMGGLLNNYHTSIVYKEKVTDRKKIEELLTDEYREYTDEKRTWEQIVIDKNKWDDFISQRIPFTDSRNGYLQITIYEPLKKDNTRRKPIFIFKANRDIKVFENYQYTDQLGDTHEYNVAAFRRILKDTTFNVKNFNFVSKLVENDYYLNQVIETMFSVLFDDNFINKNSDFLKIEKYPVEKAKKEIDGSGRKLLFVKPENMKIEDISTNAFDSIRKKGLENILTEIQTDFGL